MVDGFSRAKVRKTPTYSPQFLTRDVSRLKFSGNRLFAVIVGTVLKT